MVRDNRAGAQGAPGGKKAQAWQPRQVQLGSKDGLIGQLILEAQSMQRFVSIDWNSARVL